MLSNVVSVAVLPSITFMLVWRWGEWRAWEGGIPWLVGGWPNTGKAKKKSDLLCVMGPWGPYDLYFSGFSVVTLLTSH